MSLHALALLVATVAAPADRAGVCVLTATPREEARAVAAAAQQTLGDAVPVLDVASPEGAQGLERACRRAALVVGRGAFERAGALLGRVPVVTAMLPATRELLRAGVAVASVDPHPSEILHTLKRLAPAVRRVGLVYDPALNEETVRLAEQAAPQLGMELIALRATSLSEAIVAFHAFEDDVAIDALWLLPDKTTTTYETAHQALKLAHWRRVPVVGPSRWYVANGAMFALAPRYEAHGQTAARLLLSLLADPKDLGGHYATDNVLLLSQRAVDRLGLRIPAELRRAAGEVLE